MVSEGTQAANPRPELARQPINTPAPAGLDPPRRPAMSDLTDQERQALAAHLAAGMVRYHPATGAWTLAGFPVVTKGAGLLNRMCAAGEIVLVAQHADGWVS